jgi:hypothetical protein
LVTPGTLADRTLGARISVSGSTAAVVALADNSSSTGSVYLYDAQEDWRLITELNSASNKDNFGQNIILQNNILIKENKQITYFSALFKEQSITYALFMPTYKTE